jgi:hypothetical protein
MNPTMQNTCAAAARLAKTAAFCGILTATTLAVSSSAFAQTPNSLFPLPSPVVSTVPSNGDVNPYGVVFTPNSVLSGGVLRPGDILVSNFNNSQNLQGTGTTIIRVGAHGDVTTFFQGQAGLGLTAALGVVKRGVVFVGNLPTADGTSATVKPGSLLVIDRNGKLLGSLADPALVNGPWGMAVNDQGASAQIFFSNVLTGTVTRLDVEISTNGEQVAIRDAVTIASGYSHRTDPAALVLGPSGLFFDARHDILYVASSADNAVYAISNASNRTNANEGTGTAIYRDNVHLHGPIDLVMTPTGNLIAANSDGSNADPNQPSELVEFTVEGQFVAQFSVDKNNGGAFGVALTTLGGSAVRLAAVDDNANTLNIFIEPIN